MEIELIQACYGVLQPVGCKFIDPYLQKQGLIPWEYLFKVFFTINGNVGSCVGYIPFGYYNWGVLGIIQLVTINKAVERIYNNGQTATVCLEGRIDYSV